LKRTQTQKTSYCIISFVLNVQDKKIHREIRQIVARGWAKAEEELLMPTGSLSEVKKKLESIQVVVVQLCGYTKTH
jgi:hypothetical protein